MKESRFQKLIVESLKLHNPHILIKPITDRYSRGICDLLMWYKRSSVGIELKYIDKPYSKVKVLRHPFSDLQMMFLDQLRGTGNLAVGIIGVGDIAYIISPDYLAAKRGQVMVDDLETFNSYKRIKGEGWRLILYSNSSFTKLKFR